MIFKRVVSSALLLTFLFTFILGTSVFANTISQEKYNLMVAAGEIKPDSKILSEEDVKIKREAAVELAKEFIGSESNYDIGSINFNIGQGLSGAGWYVNFNSKSKLGENGSVSIDANTGELINFNIWQNYNGTQNYIAKFTRSELVAYANAFLNERLKLDLAQYELQQEFPYSNNNYVNSNRISGVKEPVIMSFNYVKSYKGVAFSGDSIYVGVDAASGRVVNYNRTFSNADIKKLPSTDKTITSEQALEKFKQYSSVDLQYVTIYANSPYGSGKPHVKLVYTPFFYTDKLDAVSGKPLSYDGTEIASISDIMSSNPLKPLKPDGVMPAVSEINEAKANSIAQEKKKVAETLLGTTFENQDMYKSSENENFYLSWNKSVKTVNYNFNLSLNRKTGHINNLYFSKYDYTTEKEAAAGKTSKVIEKVSWEKGRQKAIETIKKIIPEQYGFFAETQTKKPVLSSMIKDTMKEHNYSFIRTVNGIPFRDNTLNIGIDRRTGEVRSFYFNWSDFDFPKAGNLIPAEKVNEIYYEGIKPRLSYFQNRTYDKELQRESIDPIPKLVYNFFWQGFPYSNSLFVDAATGIIFDYNGNEIPVTIADNADEQSADNWAFRSIELLSGMGIIKDRSIPYENELSRLEAVKMLSLARGFQYFYNNSQSVQQTFTDISSDDPNFGIVENAVRLGIIEKAEYFNGSEGIAKSEFTRLLVNMIGYSELAKQPDIFRQDDTMKTDSANAGYAAICKALGILPVKPGDGYDDSKTVTFGEAAAALYKALAYIR